MNRFTFLVCLFLSASASTMCAQDSTRLEFTILNKRTAEPLGAVVTLYRNSDYVLHSSAIVRDGNFTLELKDHGWFLVEILAPNCLHQIDTFWIRGNDREIVRVYQLEPIEAGYTISLSNVNFYFNSTYLKPEADTVLDSVVNFLNTHPAVSVEVGGHTDDEGPADYNLSLSQGRADSIVKFLIRQGIEAERLLARGYGESRPLDAGITKAAKARNRRVEFVVTEVEADAGPGESHSLVSAR